MIAHYLSAMWRVFAPDFGNHLWQSTLFAVTAGLLTLILRKNQARIRYSLWLTASMKFLIPFSLLVGMGNHLTWSHRPAGTKAGFYIAMEEVGQPFTQPTISMIPQGTASTGLIHLLPAILSAGWLCGFLAVVFVWYRRWRQVSTSLGEAEPLREGRELQALRRLERMGRIRKPIEVHLSRTSLEPGIFGIAQPVLIWPQGISERLEDAHLDAILVHEILHVRRQDNLAAALHMLVEAVFWFHPLVWWLGSRLVEERERACDEAVVESGSERQVYAESILKICEFCVGSPLACVSGVTGADLKKRMVHIMTKNATRQLDFSRKLLLSVAGLAAFAAPVIFGLVNAPQGHSQPPKPSESSLPSFEAASVKLNHTGEIRFSISLQDPTRFTATNITTKMLIQFAYNVRDFQLSGGPDWINSERYDIDAKIKDSLADQAKNLTFFQRQDMVRPMLQALLSDRLGLKVTRETKELPIYALVVAKSGPKLSQASLAPSGSPTASARASTPQPEGKAIVTLVGSVGAFADALSRLPELGRVVMDQTGLKGNYDFLLQWTPADSAEFATRGERRAPANPRLSDASELSIFTAIQEQLGLKLESKNGPVPVLLIDRVEKPAETQTQNTVATAPVFEGASIKPNENGEPMAGFEIVGKPFTGIMWKADRLMATNFTLHGLIRVAYSVQDDQISGGPDWTNSEGYDIDAKIGKSTLDEMQKTGRVHGVSGRTRMFQALLADRFKLALHSETREIPVYTLVVAKGALKLQEAKLGDTYANGLKCAGGRPCGAGMELEPEPNKLVGQGVPISNLVDLLSEKMGGRVVVDKTGLISKYDFTLQFTPDSSQGAILIALQEQLGLKLETQKLPIDVLVIDHVERASEN